MPGYNSNILCQWFSIDVQAPSRDKYPTDLYLSTDVHLGTMKPSQKFIPESRYP